MVIDNKKVNLMNDEIVERYLEQVRKGTKVPGLTLQDKLLALSSRWTKCAEDCKNSDDKSEFRRQFGQVHSLMSKTINSWSTFEAEIIREHLKNIKNYFLNQELPFYLSDFKENRGCIEGLIHIVAEIEFVLG
jgi:hypothetical protein